MRGLAISIMLSGALASIQPVPALRNGGFEQAQEQAAPDGWRNASVPDAGYRVETIDVHPYEGRLAVRLRQDKTAQAKSPGRLAQALDVAPLRGHRVRFSAAVRLVEGDRPPELSMVIVGPDGKPAFANYSRPAPIASHDWAVYTVEADVDALATRLTVGLVLPPGRRGRHGRGNAYRPRAA